MEWQQKARFIVIKHHISDYKEAHTLVKKYTEIVGATPCYIVVGPDNKYSLCFGSYESKIKAAERKMELLLKYGLKTSIKKLEEIHND